MLTVTDAASSRLADKLNERHVLEGVAVRVFITAEDEVDLRLDGQEPDDTTYEHDGRVVLLLNEEVSVELAGYVLDVSEQDNEFSLEPLHQPPISAAGKLS